VRQKWAASDDQPRAEPLTAKQQARYEKLVGKVAGNERLFTEKRKQAAQTAARKEITEELRVHGLPRRPVYAEVGSIALPRFVLTWLKNSRGQFTIADVAVERIAAHVREPGIAFHRRAVRDDRRGPGVDPS
jgi:hypothetical protein